MVGTVVERPILQERGALPQGALAWVSTYLYNGTPAQLGAEYEDVLVPTEVGEMPAWHMPPRHAEKDALIVVVHGHGGSGRRRCGCCPPCCAPAAARSSSPSATLTGRRRWARAT
ncbi:hypothetical protein MSS93_06135 [Deinococcus radiodurans]|nr:hypothetical protein MSS93_06135 [Deinococcus radiodurans]